MEFNKSKGIGLELLITVWKDEFYCENKDLYSVTDYRIAERKYIKYKLKERNKVKQM